ncbi:hypothetical protein D3C76_889370 [compost metagenome]
MSLAGLNGNRGNIGGAVGAGVPAKQAPQWMARASPVFAGTPAPTEITPSIFVLSTTAASAGMACPFA